MKRILAVLIFCISINLNSQVQLSVYSEVSIITAGPGDELFEAFGHSAIRIKDPVLRLDLVYNYGIFDFNDPNFYMNFTKGKLLYKLGRYEFKYFLRNYNADKRWVKEQFLNLTQPQRQAFFMYLERNALEQNASYLYDPFYNNCATKLVDITKAVLKDNVKFNDDDIEKNKSLRTLMNYEIHWNTWGGFGINLALGSKLDKTVATEKYMYLPDFVYAIYKNSMVIVNDKEENLIKKETTVLEFEEKGTKVSLFNPFLIFSIICLIGLFITYKDYKNKKRSTWLDFILLASTGLIGLLITFLWFFTDHSTTPTNFNIFWAFPVNFIILFLIIKNNKPKWLKQYFKILILLLLLVPIFSILNIQQFPLAGVPIFMLLFVRYLFLSIKIN